MIVKRKLYSFATQEIAKKYPGKEKVIRFARKRVAKGHHKNKQFMDLYESEFKKVYEKEKPRLIKENAERVEFKKDTMTDFLKMHGISGEDAKKLVNR